MTTPEENPVRQQTPQETRAWLQSLQKFLYEKILPLAEPNGENRKKLVSAKAMQIWMKAFTHKSYNPNIGHNYEELEKLGDAVMKMNYIKFIMKTYPNITNSQISELVIYYLSKEEQSPISKKLELETWVRTSVLTTSHISEDVLEALFGALDLVGDQELSFGSGNILAFNLVVNLYSKIPINPIVFKGHPKSQVVQIFTKLNWGSVIEIWEANPDTFSGTMTLQLPCRAIQDLQERGINISPTLAVVEGHSKESIKRRTYLAALDYLASKGITQEWANSEKERGIRNNPDLAPLYPAAEERLHREGYVDMTFKLPQVSGQGCYAQLIGILPDERTKVLATATEATIRQAKIKVLENYATGK